MCSIKFVRYFPVSDSEGSQTTEMYVGRKQDTRRVVREKTAPSGSEVWRYGIALLVLRNTKAISVAKRIL